MTVNKKIKWLMMKDEGLWSFLVLVDFPVLCIFPSTIIFGRKPPIFPH